MDDKDFAIVVAGIWLRREGDYAVVLADVGDRWVEVIREHVEGPFSHVVSPAGIRRLATQPPESQP